MIKIAYIIPNIEVGGTEKHLLSLIAHIDKSRFSPILITTAGGGALYQHFSSIIPVFIFGGDKYKAREQPPKNPLPHLSEMIKIIKLLNEQKPQLIHAYLPAANVIGPLAGKLARVPYIITSKRSLSNYKKGYPFIVSWLESIGNLFSDIIVANSVAVKEEVENTESFCKNKIVVIYNGVEIFDKWSPEKIKEFRRKENLPVDATLAICVSNFFTYKGHIELVKAAAIVKKYYPHLIYLLIGRDVDNVAPTKELAKKMGVYDNFRFLGFRSNVVDFLQASNIFIHPSRQEGFSNSILEAMSVGLPVIACDVGGNPEAVIDSVTGKLVPKENPEALAKAILDLLKDPVRMKEMGLAGQEKVRALFSIKKMVSNIENLYEKLMQEQ